MSTIAVGASQTFNLGDGQTLEIATNGGFYSISLTTTLDGKTATSVQGPGAHAHTFGPYAGGAVLVLGNQSVDTLTVVLPPATLTAAQGAAKPVASNTDGELVDSRGAFIAKGKFVQPRIIKQFSDLQNVTLATSNATVVSSIDVASPFGVPALKLVVTFTTTAGRCEITPPALNIPNFNGHVGYSVWLDDPTKLGEMSVFVGTTGYALFQQAKNLVFNGGDMIGGARSVYAGPLRQNNVNDGGFIFGTSSAQDHKLRLTAPNTLGGTCTLWVRDCFVAYPQRPLVVFSFDDGFDSWVSTVDAAMAPYGIKATFGVNSNQIDLGASGVTSANLQRLIANGHQFSSHNVQNYRLQTLNATGNGEQNGTGTSQDAATYISDWHTGRRALEALGADPQDFMYHPWVQGGMDQIAMEALWNSGVEIARTTSPYETQAYGMPQGRNAMAIRAFPLDSTKTLAQAKAQIDLAVQYGGLCWIMGHDFGAAAGAAMWASSDLQALVAYAAGLQAAGAVDIITARQFRDRLNAYGLLDTRKAIVNANARPIRQIGRLIGANMNATTDQTITLLPGSWEIDGVYLTNASTSLTTAAGGVYTATSKGGTAIVASSQAYSAATVANVAVNATMAATPTVSGSGTTGGSVYLSLTTAQGATATADVFVYGRPV